jgi:hypothetical protein
MVKIPAVLDCACLIGRPRSCRNSGPLLNALDRNQFSINPAILGLCDWQGNNHAPTVDEMEPQES